MCIHLFFLYFPVYVSQNFNLRLYHIGWCHLSIYQSEILMIEKLQISLPNKAFLLKIRCY